MPTRNPKKRVRAPRPGQKDRQAIYAKELRKINIFKPARATSARDVKIMKDLKDQLRETWDKMTEEVDNFKRFSPKQIAFARNYAMNGRQNKSAAMRAAGYLTDNKVAMVDLANKNLRIPYMEELIAAFEMEEKVRMGLRVEDVATYFAKIADTAMENGDFTNANRAMENYGKFLGMFVERKEVTHKTVHNKDELDARIRELQMVISEERDTIAKKLAIN